MACDSPLAIGGSGGTKSVLAYAPHVRTDFILLETDDALLQEIVDDGVVFKGEADDEAVLCTRGATFQLKYVETSNTVLLLPPQDARCDARSTPAPMSPLPSATKQRSAQELASPAGLQTQVAQMCDARRRAPLLVHATATAHLQLSRAQPRLAALRALLAERPYTGSAADDDDAMHTDHTSAGSLYTWEQLLARVQASEQELRDELRALGAAHLGGFWRLLDPAYLSELLQLVLLSVAAEGWEMSSVPVAAMCECLAPHGYDSAVVRHCLELYGAPGVGSDRMAIEVLKVQRHFAHKVLAQAGPGRSLPLRRFSVEWQAALPAGLDADMSVLSGEVLVDGKGPDAAVRSFPADALPSEPRARFAALFAVRAQWEADDMEPYLKGLSVPGQTAGALLLKYVRASQPEPDGPVHYTAR